MYDYGHLPLHPAVDLLLKRMDSHPEEFTPQPARWDWDSLMGKYKEFLNQWERQILHASMRRIMMDDMHRTLMEDIVTGNSNLSNRFSSELKQLGSSGIATMQGELDFTNDR